METTVRRTTTTVSPATFNLVLIALAATLLGIEGLLRRPLLDEMTASSIVTAEHLLVAVIAIPIAIASRRELARLSRRDWIALLTIGWGASAGAALLFTQALASGNPTTASLLQNTQPLFVVLLATLILKERLSRAYWPCLAAALLGAYLLSFGPLDPRAVIAVDDARTAAFALGAAALWSAGTILGRIVLTRISSVTLTALRILLAFVFLAALTTGQGRLDETLGGLADSPARITATALGPGLAAVLLFYRGLKGTKASHATLAEFMYPVAALVGNWAILGITISPAQFIGLLLVLASVVLLARLASRAPATENNRTGDQWPPRLRIRVCPRSATG